MQEVYDLIQCKPKDLELGMIGSIGDSVLAGYAARGFYQDPVINPDNFVEDVGANCITGSDPDMTSIYTIAKHFNPQIKGNSSGTHFMNLCRSIICFDPLDRFVESDGLKMAQTGAFASNIMNQVKELVNRTITLQNKNPTLAKKWKLIAILVGLNDQFNTCIRDSSSLVNYEKYLRKAIDFLRTNLDFVIIDLLSVWNANDIITLGSNSPACKGNNRQSIFKANNPCPFMPLVRDSYKRKMKAYQIGQNNIMKKIVNEFQNKTAWYGNKKWKGTKNSFKLIYDPSAEEMDFSKMNSSILSPTDCTHPTKEMHARLATVYWKNLFLSSKEKLKNQNWAMQGELKFFCPGSIKFD